MPINVMHRLRGLAGRVLRPPAAGALVLLYHRINAAPCDPWSLNVSPAHFAAHLAVLRRLAQPTSLQDLTRSLQDGRRLRRRVVITFDDGYLDNLTHALPLLERFEVPATLFITSGYLDQAREFWWDELEQLLLHPGRLPDELVVMIDGRRHAWPLGDTASFSADDHQRHQAWRAGADHGPTARHRAYVELHRLLAVLPDAERRAVMDQLVDQRLDLRGAAGAQPLPVRPGYRPLSSEEARAIDRSRCLTIGAHTVTHPMLDQLTLDQQRQEIHAGKRALEALLQRPVTSFAYPYGRLSADTPGLVRALGFDAACTVQPGRVTAGSDPHRLNRQVVGNVSGDVFARQLAAWLQAG